MFSVTFTFQFSALNISLIVLLIAFGAIALAIITFLAIEDILDMVIGDDSDESQDTE